MSFSLYDKGDIVRREASLDSLIHKPALNKMAKGASARALTDKPEGDRPAIREGNNSKQLLAQKAYQQNEKNPAEKEKVIFAHQIMSSPVITLGEESSLAEAQKLFIEKRFRHVPIVEAKKLVGILSDRDILRYLSEDSSARIKEHMSHEVLTAKPQTTIRDLARVMFEERIGALPILDQDNKLDGIITRSDILRALVHRGPIELWG